MTTWKGERDDQMEGGTGRGQWKGERDDQMKGGKG